MVLRQRVGIDRVVLKSNVMPRVNKKTIEKLAMLYPEKVKIFYSNVPDSNAEGVWFRKIEIRDNSTFSTMRISRARAYPKATYEIPEVYIDFTVRGSCYNVQNLSVQDLRKYLGIACFGCVGFLL